MELIIRTIVAAVALAAVVLILLGIVTQLLDDESAEEREAAEVGRRATLQPVEREQLAPEPVGARHALGVATGSQAQAARWSCATSTFPAVTG